ncbi:hypothetical protein C5167_031913 [Papaver somniferum]|uniref:tRNA synthetases class I catalytic domain-containing protein n=1 Tax=Papaver somniferum TaxID=3469 RepID=A0A4Y7K8P9_PAPSO|nr:hypothetical protein C5167_031913 [Papaver somniferum]
MAIREFQLYNSMTKLKEIFVPKEPGKVGMYVCGVTAYDLSHIGHARAYIAFDVLYRYLKHLGNEVTYVRNFTDVDDKILQNDCAYTADGDVYFSVDKFPAYGRLSGRKLEDNLAGGGGRTQDSLTSRKRNENEFALWKAAKPGEISWESPWGPGRPGWHIECSAMSDRYLTSSFDIHGGGMDLIFPHHENELPQSCAARPNTCEIKYWMHNGFVNVTTSYHPLALRYFMMSTHYRSSVSYSLNQLEIASDTVFYLYQTLLDCEEALFQFREKNPEGSVRKGKNIRITLDAQECINKLKNDFYAKMSDDLHTQDFLNGALQEILKLTNSSLNKLKKVFPEIS